MTDDQFVGLTIMFVVLCVTLYKMHKNSFNHKKTKSSGGLVRSYETKIANPPEPPKPLFKPEPSREDANPPMLGEDKVGTKFDIVVDLLKKDRITRNESRILLSEERKMTNQDANLSTRNKLTNSFNNQFILQSNSSTHKSSYQCVVCGSFNVDRERMYNTSAEYRDGHVAKKTITCGDCNNKFSNKE